MEVLDINNFLSYKSKNTILNSKILNHFFSLFGLCNKKKNIKNNVNVLKNRNLQNAKENIDKKVNSILNKLSESNKDNLILEFIENIGKVDYDNYIEIQKTFYVKILSEIKFIKIYLSFLKLINYIYNKVNQIYNLSFFISIIETKFRIDYTNYELIDEKLLFLNIYKNDPLPIQEEKRINNLLLIKTMTINKIELFDNMIIDYCTNILLNQNYNLSDIHYWFNYLERELNNNEKDKIKLLMENTITQRENILLASLLNISQVINVSKETVSVVKIVDTLPLEIENIIEEYLVLKQSSEVKYFIENRCIDANSKNKFCELLINKYFVASRVIANDIIELINDIIKNHIIYKSNISRGLSFMTTNWKDKIKHLNKPKEKMILLLNNMKNNGITKGIEFLFEQYKITI